MNLLNGSELWIIYALVFGTVLLAVQGLYVLLFKARQEKTAINRRLALTAQLNNPNEVLEVLRRERGFEFLTRISALQQLNDLIIQSGVRASGFSFLLLAVVLGLAIVALLTLRARLTRSGIRAGGPGHGRPCLSVSAHRSAAPHRGVRRAVSGRTRRDGARTAGRPSVPRCRSGLVAREMPDPVGSEFGIVADEVMFGLEQSAAIDNLFRRVGHADLLFFATAVNVQHQTGGNLAEILTRLSRLLRSRSKLRLKIRALEFRGAAVRRGPVPCALRVVRHNQPALAGIFHVGARSSDYSAADRVVSGAAGRRKYRHVPHGQLQVLNE